MSVLLFKLSAVPEDEADDIRELLSESGVDFYETSAGRWGVSLPAIWLKDDSQLEQGKRLIEKYQLTRFQNARREYDQLQQEGSKKTFLSGIKGEPLRLLIYLLAIGLVAYLSLMPFFQL